MKSFLPLKKLKSCGTDFQFSGNNGTIKCALIRAQEWGRGGGGVTALIVLVGVVRLKPEAFET